MTLYLSRASLSRAPSARALNALLMPEETGRRTDAHHRLLWTLFADHPDRSRDFLWREERSGEFAILSARKPVGTDLFDRLDCKPFAPVLTPGDRLHFALRANATRSKDRKRVDVVMHALHPFRPEQRAEQRMSVATTEGAAWLGRLGARQGFEVTYCEATDYKVHALPHHKGPRSRQPQFGILDLVGEIAVADPTAFVAAVAAGFGRAKAFGCGLMMLRRAR